MDTDASQKAASLKFILNKFYSDAVQEEGQKGRIFAEAEQMIDERQPVFKIRGDAPLIGVINGVSLRITVDTLLAGWGKGDDRAWLAFCWFKGGWVRALQPLTQETVISMPWLDDFVKNAVKKELEG